MTDVLATRAALVARVEAVRGAGETIGLVPTMGALHDGHRALLDRARGESDIVICTIYVNPLQFNQAQDLAAYPRDLAADLELLRALGIDYCFAPSDEEMYPRSPQVTVEPGPLADELEGAIRPGHFRGVATVVTKLFALAGRCRAYFGEKDFQQLVIVRGLCTDLSLPVEVVGCATVREPDGLALSSRNVRLDETSRAAAPVFHRALLVGTERVERGASLAEVEQAMVEVCASEPLARLDYATVRAPDLTAVERLTGEVRLLIAGQIGGVRLIDNVAAHA